MGEWLVRRRKLLAQLKKQVALRMGPVDRELETYRSVFDSEFDGQWKPCLRSQMILELNSAPIVFWFRLSCLSPVSKDPPSDYEGIGPANLSGFGP